MRTQIHSKSQYSMGNHVVASQFSHTFSASFLSLFMLPKVRRRLSTCIAERVKMRVYDKEGQVFGTEGIRRRVGDFPQGYGAGGMRTSGVMGVRGEDMAKEGGAHLWCDDDV